MLSGSSPCCAPAQGHLLWARGARPRFRDLRLRTCRNTPNNGVGGGLRKPLSDPPNRVVAHARSMHASMNARWPRALRSKGHTLRCPPNAIDVKAANHAIRQIVWSEYGCESPRKTLHLRPSSWRISAVRTTKTVRHSIFVFDSGFLGRDRYRWYVVGCVWSCSSRAKSRSG